MEIKHREYYDDMVRLERAYLITDSGHLSAIVTFFIGSDDNKFLYSRVPWTVLQDDPFGDTVYIDQLITCRTTHRYIHRGFSNILNKIKDRFPNVKQAKWSRAPACFRKATIREGKPNVHCKDIRA